MSLKFLAVLLLGSMFADCYAQSVLTGQVTDKQSGEFLPGATVIITDLAKRTATDTEGKFSISNLPAGTFNVQVNYIGYASLLKKVAVSGETVVNFELEPSALELHQAVVTASVSASHSRTNSVSVEGLSKNQLLEAPAGNLVEALSRVAGVSQITTGPGISKPVIRGLSYNRVLTVHNGVKQEGQQWGDEHGLEFDQFAADRVEILRGPASLLYGSDAMGGVVNILDPLPAQEGHITGELSSRYATNNGLTGNSLMLEGNQKGFVWRARGTYKNAYSYRTPSGYVNNTAFNEKNFSGMLGLNKRWGYSHLNISHYNGTIGFLEHEHEEGEEEEHLHDPKDRHVEIPRQHIRHLKASLNNNFILGNGQLRVILGYQRNKRQEFEESENRADLDLNLQTYTADVKYFFPETGGFEPIIGIAGSIQDNQAGGREYLIPGYEQAHGGVFAYVKKTLDKLSLNAGARFDYRNTKGESLVNAEGEEQFQAFSSDFSNVSGSLGMAYELGSGFVLKANAGSAFRAPNISELSSNGEHHGVERYEIGNKNLKSERSFQLDASLGYTSTMLDFELNGYTNVINRFIYIRRTGDETIEHEGEVLPVYRYTQSDARLSGMEAEIDLHPLPWIHYGSGFSYVRGINQETDQSLPFIPAATWRNELRFEPELQSDLLKDAYIMLSLESTFDQPKTDPEFETPTPGYNLLNAGIGATLMLKNQPVKLYISGNNLLDRQYVDHLNRLKYSGVFNPGRDIRFGIQIPFRLR